MGFGGGKGTNSTSRVPPAAAELPTAPRLNIKAEPNQAGDPQVTPLAITNPIDNAINLPNQTTESLGVGGVVRGNTRRVMGESGGGSAGGRYTTGLPSSQNPLIINQPKAASTGGSRLIERDGVSGTGRNTPLR